MFTVDEFKVWMERFGLNAADVAFITALHTSTVWRYLNGHPVNNSTLKLLSMVYGKKPKRRPLRAA